MALPRTITSNEFYIALRDAGILREEDGAKRVVIDANEHDAVMIYVERYGDERLLNVVTTLNGIEISSVPADGS